MKLNVSGTLKNRRKLKLIFRTKTLLTKTFLIDYIFTLRTIYTFHYNYNKLTGKTKFSS